MELLVDAELLDRIIKSEVEDSINCETCLTESVSK